MMAAPGLSSYLEWWNSARIPHHLHGLKAMLSLAEKSTLYKIGRDVYTGRGVIVDAGAFLGGSAIAFAEGILASGRERLGTIRSYDRGICDKYMADLLNSWLGLNLREGESFSHILVNNIDTYKPLIDLRLGDIMDTAIVEGERIEVLFLDVCKTAEINAFVSRHFFPQLIAGQSIIIQQDFFSGNLPWIHMSLGQFASRLELLGYADSSALYRLKEPITAVEASRDPWTTMSVEDALDCFERAVPRDLMADQRYQLDQCRAIALLWKGHRAAARDALRNMKWPAPADRQLSFEMDQAYAHQLRKEAEG